MTQAATLAQLASSGALSADTSGNVGIGTTSPRLLAGYTTLGINNTTGGFTDIFAANTRVASFGADATSTYVSAVASAPLLFATGNTERMRIDTTGGVRIKTTSNIFNGPVNEALTVDNGTNGNAATFSTNATGGFPVLYLRHQVAGSNNQIIFYSSAGVAGSITSNGLAVAYNTSSDYRLKENVQPMVGALDKVAQLKPCTYTWKFDGSASEGFIAHELAEVCPNAVVGVKDEVDKNGKPIYQGIDTSFLVATLTAALQELKAELDVCKAEIAALKGV